MPPVWFHAQHSHTLTRRMNWLDPEKNLPPDDEPCVDTLQYWATRLRPLWDPKWSTAPEFDARYAETRQRVHEERLSKSLEKGASITEAALKEADRRWPDEIPRKRLDRAERIAGEAKKVMEAVPKKEVVFVGCNRVGIEAGEYFPGLIPLPSSSLDKGRGNAEPQGHSSWGPAA